VSGRVEQFVLKVGDIVSPVMRPAGVLIPAEAGRKALFAGFGQLEAQVIKVGMAAEATCVSKPLTVIPMVVTAVQDYIAAGQVRAGEQLIEAQQVTRPGTLLATLEPLYEGGLDGDARQQLHCECLYRQPRAAGNGEVGIFHPHLSPHRRHGRGRARHHPARASLAASGPDLGVLRALTRLSISSLSSAPP
jgi:hypothetical protein